MPPPPEPPPLFPDVSGVGAAAGLGFENCGVGVNPGVELGVAAGCALCEGALADADELFDAELPVVSGGLTAISLFGSACTQVVFPASSVMGFDCDCAAPELA
jgi:hypothetical protein